MGLCTSCGGLLLDPKYERCYRCRARIREKKLQQQYIDAYIKPKPRREIKSDHKCWDCVWSVFLGDRFFCPLIEGTCVKENKIDDK